MVLIFVMLFCSLVADPDLHLSGEEGGTFESLTMNVEFCQDNSGRSKVMRYFRKRGGGGAPRAPPLDLPRLQEKYSVPIKNMGRLTSRTKPLHFLFDTIKGNSYTFHKK